MFTLMSDLKCPYCNSARHVKRVSQLVAEPTATVQAEDAARVSAAAAHIHGAAGRTNGTGRANGAVAGRAAMANPTAGETLDGTVTTRGVTPGELPLQAAPEAPDRPRSGCLFYAGIAAALYFAFMAFSLYTTPNFEAVSSRLSIFFVLMAAFAMVFVFWRLRSLRPQQRAYRRAHKAWTAERHAWRRSYYCTRHHIFFDPVTGDVWQKVAD